VSINFKIQTLKFFIGFSVIKIFIVTLTVLEIVLQKYKIDVMTDELFSLFGPFLQVINSAI